MKRGAEERTANASVSFLHCSFERRPVRSRWASIRAREQSIRRKTCSRDISSEKIPTRFFPRSAAFCATFKQKVVFPMAGRAATTIKSDL